MDQLIVNVASNYSKMQAVKSSRTAKAPKAETKSRAQKVNRVEVVEDELQDMPHEEINFLDKTRDKIATARDFESDDPDKIEIEPVEKDEMSFE